ncbi:MAG: lysophospholipid acyltransferase family protein [Longimicrobiales bacterium]
MTDRATDERRMEETPAPESVLAAAGRSSGEDALPPVPADDRRPTFVHRLEHLAFTGGTVLGRLLGDAASARLGAAIGRLGYRPLGIRRGLVESHLRAAFPDADDEWIAATATSSYAHLGREMIALLRLADLSRGALLARSRLEGLPALRSALERGNGVVIAAGHFGNWEIGAAILAAHDVPIDIVAQRQHNPLFDRAIIAARHRLGVGVIERSQATRLALRALRRGRAVAFGADQNAGRTGVFVPFFGRLASTHRGAAVMALRTEAPIFLAVPLRAGSGYAMRVEEVAMDRGGEPEQVIARLTAAFTARLEAAVRAEPGQYLWHHRRWKTRPPEERNDGSAV